MLDGSPLDLGSVRRGGADRRHDSVGPGLDRSGRRSPTHLRGVRPGAVPPRIHPHPPRRGDARRGLRLQSLHPCRFPCPSPRPDRFGLGLLPQARPHGTGRHRRHRPPSRRSRRPAHHRFRRGHARTDPRLRRPDPRWQHPRRHRASAQALADDAGRGPARHDAGRLRAGHGADPRPRPGGRRPPPGAGHPRSGQPHRRPGLDRRPQLLPPLVPAAGRPGRVAFAHPLAPLVLPVRRDRADPGRRPMRDRRCLRAARRGGRSPGPGVAPSPASGRPVARRADA